MTILANSLVVILMIFWLYHHPPECSTGPGCTFKLFLQQYKRDNGSEPIKMSLHSLAILQVLDSTKIFSTPIYSLLEFKHSHRLKMVT